MYVMHVMYVMYAMYVTYVTEMSRRAREAYAREGERKAYPSYARRAQTCGHSRARLRAELRCALSAVRETDAELRTSRSVAAASTREPAAVSAVGGLVLYEGEGGGPSGEVRVGPRRRLSYNDLEAQAIQATLTAAELRLERDELALSLRKLSLANEQAARTAASASEAVGRAREPVRGDLWT